MRARRAAPTAPPAPHRSAQHRASCSSHRCRAHPSRLRLLCTVQPCSAFWTLMRARPREIAILRPVAERSRHPAHITVVRERFQEHRGNFSKRANRPRMARSLRKAPRSAPRLLDRPRPLQRMVAGALFPAEMEQDSRDVDLYRAGILARAAEGRSERQMARRAAKEIRTDY